MNKYRIFGISIFITLTLAFISEFTEYKDITILLLWISCFLFNILVYKLKHK